MHAFEGWKSISEDQEALRGGGDTRRVCTIAPTIVQRRLVDW
jgi:hypothetical protein